MFWFTLEFGVVRERGELRTYGAGLLSSFGEIQAFATPSCGRSTSSEMADVGYDITRFQDVLFAADSFDDVEAGCSPSSARSDPARSDPARSGHAASVSSGDGAPTTTGTPDR